LEQDIKGSYFNGHKAESLQLSEKDIAVLLCYLRRALVVEPKYRATAQDLLAEEWVREDASDPKHLDRPSGLNPSVVSKTQTKAQGG
jgi:hypothetical protein